MNNDVIRLIGGQSFDSSRGGLCRSADLWLASGRIAAGELKSPHQVLDTSGCLIVPGLVDFHTHVFAGQDLGVEMDLVGPPTGVTTFIDAGSAGAHLFGAFRRSVAESSSNVAAFLNISTIGTTSILLAGEAETLSYCSVEAAVAAVEQHSDMIVGIKVRSSGNVVGSNGKQPFLRAREVADRTQLPLMVHIGPPPPDIGFMLANMRQGDILTHCFTGFNNRIVNAGQLIDGLEDAIDRGVLLDVGHGMAGFDIDVARQSLAAGVQPHIISTDIHAYSQGIVRGLDRVMTIFLSMGMPLTDVLTAVTSTPAGAIGRSASLEPGARADVTVLRIVNEAVELVDPSGNEILANESLQVAATITAGRVTFRNDELLG